MDYIANLHNFGSFTPELQKHIDGGSYDGETFKENRDAWKEYKLRPRCLVDVSNIDLSTNILGVKTKYPFGIAPMGHIGLIHERGELELAEACEDIIYCPATVSTKSMEEISKATLGRKWFQLYLTQDDGLNQELIDRAVAAKYEAIVLTVDSPVVGWREQKSIPPQTFGNFEKEIAGEDIRKFIKKLLAPWITWDYIDKIFSKISIPIILKGIINHEDAIRAAEWGASGVWISNHGGRQLDRVEATAHILRDVSHYDLNTEIYVDGGIRRGTDVAVALGMGATAVFIGRPVLYALGYQGAEGVRKMINILAGELENTMALLGCRSIQEITRAHIG